MCQDFDTKRFNFTKVPQKEILFQIDETAHAASFEHSAALSRSPNLVLINVSPIEYGHVLLVPRVLDCLPQACLASGVNLPNKMQELCEMQLQEMQLQEASDERLTCIL